MKDKEVRPKTSTVSSKSVTIKKGSSSVTPLEVKTSARDRLDGVLEAERFRLSSLVASLALIIVFSAIVLVICCILIASFKLPLLTMASENFRAAPVIMVIASCLSIGTRTSHNSFFKYFLGEFFYFSQIPLCRPEPRTVAAGALAVRR
jgi:hypothetical protein